MNLFGFNAQHHVWQKTKSISAETLHNHSQARRLAARGPGHLPVIESTMNSSRGKCEVVCPTANGGLHWWYIYIRVWPVYMFQLYCTSVYWHSWRSHLLISTWLTLSLHTGGVNGLKQRKEDGEKGDWEKNGFTTGGERKCVFSQREAKRCLKPSLNTRWIWTGQTGTKTFVKQFHCICYVCTFAQIDWVCFCAGTLTSLILSRTSWPLKILIFFIFWVVISSHLVKQTIFSSYQSQTSALLEVK